MHTTIREYQIVDEVTRDTAERLQQTEAILAWKADGDGAFVIEPRDE